MITIAAEQIAAELRWRLSNSNAELDTMDIAYDTYEIDGAPTAFVLNVQGDDLETRARASARFIVRIEVAQPDAPPNV